MEGRYLQVYFYMFGRLVPTGISLHVPEGRYRSISTCSGRNVQVLLKSIENCNIKVLVKNLRNSENFK